MGRQRIAEICVLSGVAPTQWLPASPAGTISTKLKAPYPENPQGTDPENRATQSKAYCAAAQDVEPNPEYLLANCRSEEHTSELQSLMRISYAVFCLKKKQKTKKDTNKYSYTEKNT